MKNNLPEKALDLFNGISSKADGTLITIAFSACADLHNERALQLGRTLLSQLPSKFLNETILMNSAINMLMKFGDVAHAERLFHKLNKKSIVTYGAMMKGKDEWSDPLDERCTILRSGYVTNNLPEKALELFDDVSSEANAVLYTIVFSACADLSNERAVQSGKKYLEQTPSSLLNDALLVSSAIHMLMKFGDVTRRTSLSHAERLFYKLNKKSIVTYGAMMKGK